MSELPFEVGGWLAFFLGAAISVRLLPYGTLLWVVCAMGVISIGSIGNWFAFVAGILVIGPVHFWVVHRREEMFRLLKRAAKESNDA